MFGKGGSSRQRMEDVARKVVQRSAMGQGHDVTRFGVIIDGKVHITGQRRNEVVKGLTVSSLFSEVDSSGRVFGSVKDVVVCSGCGCMLNGSSAVLHRCFICKRINCLSHSVVWKMKDVSFCRRSWGCWLVGRLLQVGWVGISVLGFCVSQVTGVEFGAPRASQDARRGLEGDEDEIVMVDEREIARQLERMRELERGRDY